MANRKQSRQQHPRFGYRTALLAAVCFVLPQVVIANSLLHHFYVHGAPLYDAGWFAYWTTHALTLDVTTIPSINDRPMLATHVFLFFFSLSYIYQIFSSFLSEQVYFSIVQGAWAGMVSLATFLCGYRAINCWLLAVISIATGLNPFVFTSTSFPHVEMAMPAFIALFIAFYVRLREHRRLWWMPFLPLAGLLSVREDAGLHGFGLFILLTAYFWWCARERRDIWQFFGLASLICIGYSVVALLVRQSFSVGDDIMVWKFTGSPPYAHLTATLKGNDNMRDNVVHDGFSFSYIDKIAPVDHATDITHRLIVNNAMGEFIMVLTLILIFYLYECYWRHRHPAYLAAIAVVAVLSFFNHYAGGVSFALSRSRYHAARMGAIRHLRRGCRGSGSWLSLLAGRHWWRAQWLYGICRSSTNAIGKGSRRTMS